MSSQQYAVITYLKEALSNLDDGLVASKNQYDLNRNDGVNNDFIYAVRPGSGSKISGSVGRATWQQNFYVEISKDFLDVDETDSRIEDAVEAITQKFEALALALVGRPSGQIMNIDVPDFDEPVINQNPKSVSITYTFPVKYFISLRSS